MVVFILTMPNVGSWNGKWSGADRMYARVMTNRRVPKEVIGKNFFYDFGDGWGANIEVKQVDNNEARKYKAKSVGFYGYDWMITSIINDHNIVSYKIPLEKKENTGNDVEMHCIRRCED